MIEFLTNKLLKYISNKDVIDNVNEDVVAFYKYGIEITISSILNILIILTISLLFNALIDGFIFLLIFIPTRQFTGGFHADSYLKCNLTFAISFSITLLMSRYIFHYIESWSNVLFLVIDIIFVVIFCPIENEHKPIYDKKQYIRCKFIGVLLFAVFGIVGTFIVQSIFIYGSMILYTLNLIVVLGIIGILKERRRKHEKAEQNSYNNC